jgi:uncharacterized protein (DUF305 family)
VIATGANTVQTGGPSEDPPVARRHAHIWMLLVGLTVLAALIAGLVVGQRMTSSVLAVDDPVDLGFSREMKIHHAQAVETSSIVYRRTDDPALATLAFDILTTQQGQIGIMTGWLGLWRQGQGIGAERPMVWMGQPHDGPMPGMASPAQVAALRTLPVARMNESFLRLMIEHHRGALPMAAYAAKHASSPDVRLLAANMDASQAAEIDAMQAMLRERGWAPQPEPAPSQHGGHS